MVISNLKFSILGGGSNLKFSMGGYFGVNSGHLKSEVFHFGGGGGYFGVNFGHLKSEVFHFGGGGAFQSEIPQRGFLENLNTNFTV